MKAFITTAIAGVLILFTALFFVGYVGFRNTANQYEQDITAQYEQVQNVYDNGWKQVQEIAQVPTLQANNYKTVYDDVMKGRYGADGSKAMMQFVQEQNPNLGSEVYTKIQRAIETFHGGFSAAQQDLIAKKQADRTFLTSTTDSLMYNWIGHYPHIKIGLNGQTDDFAIVTSEKTATDFKTKKAQPLNILNTAVGGQ